MSHAKALARAKRRAPGYPTRYEYHSHKAFTIAKTRARLQREGRRAARRGR